MRCNSVDKQADYDFTVTVSITAIWILASIKYKAGKGEFYPTTLTKGKLGMCSLSLSVSLCLKKYPYVKFPLYFQSPEYLLNTWTRKKL